MSTVVFQVIVSTENTALPSCHYVSQGMESEEGLQDPGFLERREANLPGVLLHTATRLMLSPVHCFSELRYFFLIFFVTTVWKTG